MDLQMGVKIRIWIRSGIQINIEIIVTELYILSFECCFVNSKNSEPYFMEDEKITFISYY